MHGKALISIPMPPITVDDYDYSPLRYPRVERCQFESVGLSLPFDETPENRQTAISELISHFWIKDYLVCCMWYNTDSYRQIMVALTRLS